MRSSPSNSRRLLSPFVALVLVGSLYLLSRDPALSPAQADALASRFHFDKTPLPEMTGYPRRLVREVHPSLKHISGMISFVGAAVALADLDGDGLPNDLLYVDPRIDQVSVGPVPGTPARYELFTLTPEPLPFTRATMAPMGCLVGDFNEDGLADVLVYYWGRSPIVFLQRQPVTSAAKSVLSRERFIPRELIEPHQVWYSSAVTQADLNGAGHIDLFVGNYFPDGSGILDAGGSGTETMPHSLGHAYNGSRDHLFLWQAASKGPDPSVRFLAADEVLDEEVARGWTFALGAADLDGDMLPEIYLVQDWGPDRLLHNRSQPGRLRFTRLHGERTWTTPRSKVVGRDSFNGMGVDFGDLNGDGWPDIFVSNITGPWGLHESHFVFLSTGQVERMHAGIAPYRDASEDLGLSRSGWAWEARLADFDNDGVLEAMQATGFLRGQANRWPEAQELALGNDEVIALPGVWPRLDAGADMSGGDHNPFFVRARDGRYHDIAARLGMAEPMCSRGIAVADVDGDGRLDFAVANQWGPSFFFATRPRTQAPSSG